MADDATQIENDRLPPEDVSEGVDELPPQHAHREEEPAPRKKAKVGNVATMLGSMLGAVFSLIFLIVIVGLLAITGRSVQLPQWAVDRVETRINAELTGERIKLDSIAVGLRDKALRPTVDVAGIALYSEGTAPILELPNLRSKLDTSELLQGRVKLETVELEGATLELNRDKDGQIALAFGAQMGGDQVQVSSTEDLLKQIDVWFAAPWMEELEEVSAEALSIRLSDERTGEVSMVEQGTLKLTTEGNVIALNISVQLDQPNGPPAQLFFSADKAKGSEGARLVAKFNDLRARDLASQVSTLNFLSILDAPASGALTAEVDAQGQLASLAGTLNLDAGALRPTEQTKPVLFNSAKSYLRYEAATQRLEFDQISLDSPQLRLSATGHADLRDFVSGIPETLLGQLRFTNVRLAPEGLFEAPVSFETGALDLRYRPTELALDVGQLVLSNGDGTELVAKGSVDVLPKGWSVALDAGIAAIDYFDLMTLWPENAVPKTRKWLTDNVQGGTVNRAEAALRIRPEEKIAAAVSFDFSDARVRYLKTLPPVENAHGYASISGNAFNLHLNSGQVVVGDAGALEAGGSVMQIPDMAGQPAMGIFDLTLDGPVSAALHLLDQEPFGFLADSGLKPDVATGDAQVETRLSVPLIEKVGIKDIGYVVSADVRSVRSDTLIEGRALRSNLMEVFAGDGSLSIGGKGTIDGIPMDVLWSRAIGAGTGDRSKVEGTIELSPKMLDVFGVGLPDGSVSGKGTARMEVSLSKGAPPNAKLTSDLRGIGLSIAALGWSKSRGSTGALSLDLTMGDTPKVNNVKIEAGGLTADGSVTLKTGGGLDRAVFAPLRVADKLNSQVEIIGRGGNRQPRITIKGGTIDIRKFGVTSGGSSAAGPPLEFALDRLVVTDSIALDQFQGTFKNDKGMDGTFKANVNGKAAITGTVIPTGQGPAVRILSGNGGRVISASGILENVNGGEMSLTLQPNGKPGQFNGSLEIQNTRVKKAPALADLLSAISVIGLLEQLTGEGIIFTNTEARFLLSPNGVTLSSSSAVGPSMGITMDGVFNTDTRRMDMRGVVSPIYAVNGLFGALFSPRKGEGLFGFNYTLKGSSEAPKVGVNPLSMLTPGIFREIFRQPAPQLKN